MRFIVKDYLNCERCPLHQYRRNIVFGRGDIPARYLFIGEAPGVSEDLIGEPFVGPSGRILRKALELATRLLNLDEIPSHYITNVVACRPCDGKKAPNRAPTFDEAWQCWQRLEYTYQYVKPHRVVLLGEVPKKLVLKAFPQALCLQHPAYILRSGGVESPPFRLFVRELVNLFEEKKNDVRA